MAPLSHGVVPTGITPSWDYWLVPRKLNSLVPLNLPLNLPKSGQNYFVEKYDLNSIFFIFDNEYFFIYLQCSWRSSFNDRLDKISFSPIFDPFFTYFMPKKAKNSRKSWFWFGFYSKWSKLEQKIKFDPGTQRYIFEWPSENRVGKCRHYEILHF